MDMTKHNTQHQVLSILLPDTPKLKFRDLKIMYMYRRLHLPDFLDNSVVFLCKHMNLLNFILLKSYKTIPIPTLL